MLLYAISDGTGSSALPERAASWAAGGVDFIQIREKQLALKEFQQLTAAVVQAVRRTGSSTRVLLNGPAGLALAGGADGVHLPGSQRETAHDARKKFQRAFISMACHSSDEVADARSLCASMAVFAPVFGKSIPGGMLKGAGLDALARACLAAGDMPVIALGGIMVRNAHSCIQAGAAGVAGIRLFAGEEWRRL